VSWYVYLLSCQDGSLYTGITRDPQERLSVHNRGAGAAYTRSRLPVRLAYVEPAADRPTALRRELQLKALRRSRKLELLETRSAVAASAPLVSVTGFRAAHGFSTRAGGVSEGAFESLNLGGNTEDSAERVRRNRRVFSGWFGARERDVCLLDQVHGDQVVVAKPGETQRADAQISDDPSLLLVIGSADCLPLLFHDGCSGAVAAAHCGWRGTLAGLPAGTIEAMRQRFNSRPQDITVAIGPGICGSCYQVGDEVRDQFRAAGFPDSIATADDEARWRLDLVQANVHVLRRAGVARRAILAADHCTSCQPRLFFSHRRDRGVTGRHWAAVRATAPGD
jgi:YfiH family protein